MFRLDKTKFDMENFRKIVDEKYMFGHKMWLTCHSANDKFTTNAVGVLIASAYFPPLSFILIPMLAVDAAVRGTCDTLRYVPYKLLHEEQYHNAAELLYLIKRYDRDQKDEYYWRTPNLCVILNELDRKYGFELNKRVFVENVEKGNFIRPNGSLKSYKSWGPLFERSP